VGDDEEMPGEGDGAGEAEELAEAEAGEEVLSGAGWGGEQEQAGECEKRAAVGGESGACGVGCGYARDGAEQRHEDDDETGDEACFGRGRVVQAEGLELVAEREHQTRQRAEGDFGAWDAAHCGEVDGSEDEKGERHAEKVEEQRRGVCEGGFDEREGRSPDDDDGEQ
jgi:hypothetical protein